MGNNGIWALEKHPMEFLYGYSVAAELQPECRYDQVVEALGGHGELVRTPGRAAAGAGAGVRVRQAGAGERADRPAVAYPRKANLAYGLLTRAALGGRASDGAATKQNRRHHAGGSVNGPIRTGRGTCHERA